MAALHGKKILLGITAGIAAYKTAWLVRLFIKAGADVKVVMTPEAKRFITPLTLSTLSKNEVFSSFIKGENDQWNNHVELGLWADLMVIAPATANSISKMASGHDDNLLLATYLSAKCPVYFAPAMDLDMFQHETTKDNIRKLQEFGNYMIPAATGELASGLSGEGRMAEPEDISTFIENDLQKRLPLHAKKILITAGPTYEAIDPVRFLGNHSSGKMGFALAEIAAENGADVFLISGPSSQITHHPKIARIDVVSTEEMYKAVHQKFPEMDAVIAAAAVSDYRPENTFDQKKKKSNSNWELKLVKTKDILLSLGQSKTSQILVGFALETENELENAQKKLSKKNLDLIVLNSLNDKEAGFQKDTNKIQLISKENVKSFSAKAKIEVASDIIQELIPRL
jgi:phosphopantothenoylcysteine decarboxylase/phosphopantothenate--cysteine ligase